MGRFVDFASLMTPEGKGEIWKYFGITFALSQSFEEALKAAIFSYERHSKKMTVEEQKKLNERLDGKTMGVLVRDFRNIFEIHENTSDELTFLKEQRNALAHGYWSVKCFSIPSFDLRVDMERELFDISLRFAKMSDYLVAGIEKSYGYSPSDEALMAALQIVSAMPDRDKVTDEELRGIVNEEEIRISVKYSIHGIV